MKRKKIDYATTGDTGIDLSEELKRRNLRIAHICPSLKINEANLKKRTQLS